MALVPVDHDPFAAAPNTTPVEGDPFASRINPQDRLLPEVRTLGPNATDAEIQGVLDKRQKDIADQQAKQGYIPQAKELLRSAGEGVVALPETIAAAPWNVANLLSVAAGKLTGRDIPAMPPPAPVRTAYNTALPPDPTFPMTRQVGNVLGPAVVEAVAPMAGGANSALQPLTVSRAVQQGVVRPAVQTAATIAGEKTGSEFGKYYGGDTGEKVGAGLGSVFGSVAVPPAVSAAARTLHPILTDPGSPRRLEIYDRLGVPLSLGGVGSKAAATWEDALAGVPIVGNRIFETRRTQQEAMDRVNQNVSEQIRGGPSQGEISPGGIGSDVIAAAKDAIGVTKDKGDAFLNPIYDQIGRDIPLDQTQELTTLERLRKEEQPLYGRPIVEREIARTNATRSDPENPPKVVDPGLEAQLQGQLARNQATLAAAKPGSGPAIVAQANIDALNQQVKANRGATLDEVIAQRRDVADRLPEANYNLPDLTTQAIKNAKTASINQAAVLSGVDPADVAEANAQWGRLRQQRLQLTPIAKADTGTAYQGVFGGQSSQQRGLQEALDTNTPDQTMAQILANNLELKTRGPESAGGVPSAESISPQRTVNFWTSLDPVMRDRYAPPGTRARADMDALTEAYQSEMRRPTRAKTRGGNTLGAPLAFLASSGVAGIVAKAIANGDFSTAAAASFPLVSSYVASRALTNPGAVRAIVRPPDYLPSNQLSRLLSGAVSAQGQ
jgi:hypothetical protein